MPGTVFVDTGAHYALVDSGDPEHIASRTLLTSCVTAKRSLLTSDLVLGETYTLIQSRLGKALALSYCGKIRMETEWVAPVTAEDIGRAWGILADYADQDFSFVDATSFALMERLGLSVAFAFDHHFDVFRTRHGVPFTRLLP